jgi:isopentenyl diphosphate isomerase/L-lactate dehydrogenase-like FMN-dependent dehydrogenase
MRSHSNASGLGSGRWTRRSALQFAAMMAGSPLFAQQAGRGGRGGALGAQPPRPPRVYPPTYSDEVMAPVNVHEIEEIARQKISPMAYDYIAGGSAGELSLTANREAFSHLQLRRHIGVDVSKLDTSLELLGKKLEFPILLGPGGAKNLVYQNGEQVAAMGAAHSKAVYMAGPSDSMSKLAAQGLIYWAASLGFSEQGPAQTFAKRAEDAGASAISISVDYPYTAPRDRNIRNNLDYAWANTGIPANSGVSPARKQPAVAGMIWPYVPGMTWKVLDWLHAATKLPVILKGICTAEDARLAVERGAQAVIVSNHGGRTLDGMIPTLYALPEVVQAVNGRVPVLMDGGIRRGGDIVKAMSLGAKAILIGRPYYWGLAAFGQIGVQRVIEMLHGEMMVAMGQSGIPNLAAFDRSLVEFLPGGQTVVGS